MSISGGTGIFSLHYYGSISYWKILMQQESILFDLGEYFRKQDYHNRCRIAGANGMLALSVPLLGSHYQKPLSEMAISYAEPWQRVHWNAISSAYGSSPFFEHYAAAFKVFYEHREHSLMDLNLKLTESIFRMLKQHPPYRLTDDSIPPEGLADFRNVFHAKKENREVELSRYPQVFEHKSGFIPDLCIIDLLFNLGPRAADYLLG